MIYSKEKVRWKYWPVDFAKEAALLLGGGTRKLLNNRRRASSRKKKSKLLTVSLIKEIIWMKIFEIGKN